MWCFYEEGVIVLINDLDFDMVMVMVSDLGGCGYVVDVVDL